MIVVASGGSHHKGSASQPTKVERRDLGLHASGNRRPNQPPPRPQPQQTEYVVQTGDTLGSIASKTGVSVNRLQQLNPHLDPQALVSGQRLKLR